MICSESVVPSGFFVRNHSVANATSTRILTSRVPHGHVAGQQHIKLFSPVKSSTSYQFITIMVRPQTLFTLFEKDGWSLNRISGSHHVFTKSGRGCIPVAVHRGEVRPDICDSVLVQMLDAEEAFLERREAARTARNVGTAAGILEHGSSGTDKGGPTASTAESGSKERRAKTRRQWVDRNPSILATFDQQTYAAFAAEMVEKQQEQRNKSEQRLLVAIDECLALVGEGRYEPAAIRAERAVADGSGATVRRETGGFLVLEPLLEQLDFLAVFSWDKAVRDEPLGSERQKKLVRQTFARLAEMDTRYWHARGDEVRELRRSLQEYILHSHADAILTSLMVYHRNGREITNVASLVDAGTTDGIEVLLDSQKADRAALDMLLLVVELVVKQCCHQEVGRRWFPRFSSGKAQLLWNGWRLCQSYLLASSSQRL